VDADVMNTISFRQPKGSARELNCRSDRQAMTATASPAIGQRSREVTRLAALPAQ
jgi:hypothetical protein